MNYKERDRKKEKIKISFGKLFLLECKNPTVYTIVIVTLIFLLIKYAK
ncbi:hypothetical protein [Agriterribacter sp.]|nr:hypothetical protein [Agriterribacter sp.]HTN05702.1 hypothetical protein [Agriterribacter sp.]